MYYLLILLVTFNLIQGHEVVEAALPISFEEILKDPFLLLEMEDISGLQACLSHEAYSALVKKARGLFLPILYARIKKVMQFRLLTHDSKVSIENSEIIKQILLTRSENKFFLTNMVAAPLSSGSNDTLTFCMLSPNEKFCIAQSKDGDLAKIEVEAIIDLKQRLPIFFDPIPPIMKGAISNDDSVALCSTAEGLYVINLLNQVIQKFSQQELVHTLRFHDNKPCALGASSSSFFIINLTNPADPVLIKIPWYAAELRQVAFSADGASILFYTAAGPLFEQTFDATNFSLGKMTLLIQMRSAISLAPDGRYAYALFKTNAYHFDLETINELIIPTELLTESPPTCFAVSYDNNFVIIGASDGTVKLYIPSQSEQPVALLASRGIPITSLCFTKDDSRIVYTVEDAVYVIVLPAFDSLIKLHAALKVSLQSDAEELLKIIRKKII